MVDVGGAVLNASNSALRLASSSFVDCSSAVRSEFAIQVFITRANVVSLARLLLSLIKMETALPLVSGKGMWQIANSATNSSIDTCFITSGDMEFRLDSTL